MQDDPNGGVIARTVAEFLRKTVIPLLPPRAAFEARVAANALDIAAREWALSPTLDAAEQVRLEGLLGTSGALADLNRQLATDIAEGRVDPESSPVLEHLWSTAIAKLDVDQPSYASYISAKNSRSKAP